MITERPSLSRNTLKHIATAAMLIDHIATLFLPFGWLYCILRCIGRITAPIICYFLVEGFVYTSSRKKYLCRMFVFALISQIPYTLAFYGKLFTPHFSMIYTLFICLLMLTVCELKIDRLLKGILVAVCILLTIPGDWQIYAAVWVLGFYLCRNRREQRFRVYIIASVCMVVSSVFEMGFIGFFVHLGLFAAVWLLTLYNGEKGRSNVFSKWFFYIFYPLHLTLLLLVKLCFR